jgi:fumarate hydratase subunit beta
VSAAKRIAPPLSERDVLALRSGDRVLISGVLLGARDEAHRRLFALLQEGAELPVNLAGQVIYYVGPAPARPGGVIGTAGPTTAGRMDAYAPALMEAGVRGMLGKGARSAEVKDALRAYKAVYLAPVGGVGALLRKHVKSSEVIAYEDLGPEALRRLEVEDLPAFVVNDCYGGDLYYEARRAYELK